MFNLLKPTEIDSTLEEFLDYLLDNCISSKFSPQIWSDFFSSRTTINRYIQSQIICFVKHIQISIGTVVFEDARKDTYIPLWSTTNKITYILNEKNYMNDIIKTNKVV